MPQSIWHYCSRYTLIVRECRTIFEGMTGPGGNPCRVHTKAEETMSCPGTDIVRFGLKPTWFCFLVKWPLLLKDQQPHTYIAHQFTSPKPLRMNTRSVQCVVCQHLLEPHRGTYNNQPPTLGSLQTKNAKFDK